MKYSFLIFVFIVITVFPLNAQEDRGKSYLLMSGYGYNYSEFVSGFSNVNSFVYKFHKRWGAGLDFGTTTGSRFNQYFPDSSLEIQASTISLGSNIYFFAVNTPKHLVFINAGMNYTHKSMTSLGRGFVQGEPDQYWFSEKENAFGFNLSAGYSYKLTDLWSLGARLYFNQAEEYNVMGMINIGMCF